MLSEQLAQAFTSLYSYQMPPWWQTREGVLWLMVGAMVVLGLLVFGVWYRWWYRPPLTLDQWTEKQLDALAQMLTKEQVNYKVFFGAATFFFKQYVLRLYGWRLLDKTDDEFVAFVVQRGEITPEIGNHIQALFSYAQMVKFADQAALAENADEALRTVRGLVRDLPAPE